MIFSTEGVESLPDVPPSRTPALNPAPLNPPPLPLLTLTVKYMSTLAVASRTAAPTAAPSDSDLSISPSTANCRTIPANRRCKKPRATRLSPVKPCPAVPFRAEGVQTRQKEERVSAGGGGSRKRTCCQTQSRFVDEVSTGGLKGWQRSDKYVQSGGKVRSKGRRRFQEVSGLSRQPQVGAAETSFC